MILDLDQAGESALEECIDRALRQGGLSAYESATKLLAARAQARRQTQQDGAQAFVMGDIDDDTAIRISKAQQESAQED